MEGPAYLLLDEDGQPFDLATTLEEALALAHEEDPQGRIFFDAPTEQDFELIEAADRQLAANPSAKRHLPVKSVDMKKVMQGPQSAQRAVRRAMERRIDFESAKQMSLEEAHARLEPMFPKNKYTKAGKRTPVHAYDWPRGTSNKKGMAFHFLGQNYKTAKTTPRNIIGELQAATGFRSANVLGLSLLPTTQSYAEEVVQSIMASAPDTYGVEEVRPVHLNACARATRQCASSCLVFSGRNLADDYNTVKKYALTQSLIHEPQAFTRMLVENIRIHRDRSFRANTMPLVRLNVFSDLPWELMAPELFDEFHDVQFYDYTKVANRETPDNYDITFSFAGTAQNVAAMDFEITERGSRVAVVFAAIGMRKIDGKHVEVPAPPRHYRRKPGAERKTARYARLPETFIGLPVIDGDASDMRPYDPAPSIVGLRWKNPARQNVTLEKAKVFIVLVDLVTRAGGYVDAIVSKTARFDDVDYAKYAPSNTD
jgi:hypothetical protein